jgi:hypothetical protein
MSAGELSANVKLIKALLLTHTSKSYHHVTTISFDCLHVLRFVEKGLSELLAELIIKDHHKAIYLLLS